MNSVICTICNCSLNGALPLQQHISSKRHIRKAELKNALFASSGSSNSCSVYPVQLPQHESSAANIANEKKNSQLKGKLGPDGSNPSSCHPLNLGDEIQGISKVSNISSETPSANMFPACPENNSDVNRLAFLNSDIPKKGPNGEVYVMRGDRGFCYACSIELTSTAHCSQHIAGSKHRKRENESSQNNLIAEDESNGKKCNPVGGGSRCDLCDVTYTSKQHAAQHLAGQKHKKKTLASAPFGTLLQNTSSTQSSVSSTPLLHPYVPSQPLGTQRSISGRIDSEAFNVGASKVLMCSLCRVVLSGKSNAEEHFLGERHKKNVEIKRQKESASIPNNDDYSNDPEQTLVMKVKGSAGDFSSSPSSYLNSVRENSCMSSGTVINQILYQPGTDSEHEQHDNKSSLENCAQIVPHLQSVSNNDSLKSEIHLGNRNEPCDIQNNVQNMRLDSTAREVNDDNLVSNFADVPKVGSKSVDTMCASFGKLDIGQPSPSVEPSGLSAAKTTNKTTDALVASIIDNSQQDRGEGRIISQSQDEKISSEDGILSSNRSTGPPSATVEQMQPQQPFLWPAQQPRPSSSQELGQKLSPHYFDGVHGCLGPHEEQGDREENKDNLVSNLDDVPKVGSKSVDTMCASFGKLDIGQTSTSREPCGLSAAKATNNTTDALVASIIDNSQQDRGEGRINSQSQNERISSEDGILSTDRSTGPPSATVEQMQLQQPFLWPAQHPRPSPSQELGQKLSPYCFDGARGYCRPCSVELTSTQHANQHLNGQKHRKKVEQWELMIHLQDVRSTSALPAEVFIDRSVPSSRQTSTEGGQLHEEQSFYFAGSKGYCYACKIELTSIQHAQQHLNGKSHKRNHERMDITEKGKEVPLHCTICNKSFTGQESAQQHFISRKHKTKSELMDQDAQTVENLDDGRAILKGGQLWFICDICHCPLNTLDQFKIHKNTAKHIEEMQSYKTQLQSTAAQAREATPEFSPSPSPTGGILSTRNLISAKDENQLENNSISETLRANAWCISPARDEVLRQLALQENSQHLTYGGDPLITSQSSSFPSHPVNTHRDTHARTLISSPGYSQNRDTVTSNEPFLGTGTIVASQAPWPRTSIAADVKGQNYGSDRSPSPNQAQGFLAAIKNNSSTSQNLTRDSASSFGAIGDGRFNSQGRRGAQSTGRGIASGSSSANSSTGHARNEYEDGNPETSRRGSGIDSSYQNDGGEFEGMITHPKPRTTSHRGSRNSSRLPGNLSMERDIEDSDDEEDDDNDDDTNLNIVEKDTLPAAEPEKIKPPKSQNRGFRYSCPVCNRDMNTKEAYKAHIMGKNHLYMMSIKPAPHRHLEPIKKNDLPDLVRRASKVTKSMLRGYQTELVEKAADSDSIIFLPTGTGKTLVALNTIGLMLQDNPSRPVLFLVDKVLLVLQQAKYMMSEFQGKKFRRPDTSRDGEFVERELKIKVICGGLTTKEALPLWKFDVIVTTAAFCQNMLTKKWICWEDFSLVILDEVHHCNKRHPYHDLLGDYHRVLPEPSRAKILGLTASPAGKKTEEETYAMLQSLLKNLGGANIAIVEDNTDELAKFQSNAKVHPICVPLSNKEKQFTFYLCEYFVLCYAKLVELSPQLKPSEYPCNYLYAAIMKPGDREVASRIAQQFMQDPEPMSEILGVTINAYCREDVDDETQQFFFHLKKHVIELMLQIPNIGLGDKVVDGMLAPSEAIEKFERKGLPCRELYERTNQFAENGRDDQTMFSQLIQTLQDPSYIDWRNKRNKAVVLVRERKMAKQLSMQLKKTQLAQKYELRVTHLVGHGKGAQDDGMNVKKQQKVLDNQEKYHIMVATSIMEEGVDFQTLQLVVCMNPPTSVRALVQMRGRARKKDSHFVVLCSTQEEVTKLETLQLHEENMQKAAKRCAEEQRAGNARAGGIGHL